MTEPLSEEDLKIKKYVDKQMNEIQKTCHMISQKFGVANTLCFMASVGINCLAVHAYYACDYTKEPLTNILSRLFSDIEEMANVLQEKKHGEK